MRLLPALVLAVLVPNGCDEPTGTAIPGAPTRAADETTPEPTGRPPARITFDGNNFIIANCGPVSWRGATVVVGGVGEGARVYRATVDVPAEDAVSVPPGSFVRDDGTTLDTRIGRLSDVHVFVGSYDRPYVGVFEDGAGTAKEIELRWRDVPHPPRPRGAGPGRGQGR